VTQVLKGRLGGSHERLPRPARSRRPDGRRLLDLGFIVPAALAIIVVLIYPVIYGIKLSLDKTNNFNATTFTGLSNYRRALTDPVFQSAIIHTVAFTAAAVVVQTGLGVLLAVLVSEIKRGRTFLRFAFFSPYVLAPIAVGTAWKFIFAPYFGVFASLNTALGIGSQTVAPLSSTTLALPAIFVSFLWRYAGFNMVLYLAAMQSIPEDYYEVAWLEGASRIQQFRHITWPLLWPQTFVVVVLTTVGTLHIFDMVWIMTEGGPGNATQTASTYIYKTAFTFYQPGIAQAMAMVVFVLAIVLTYVEFRILQRKVAGVSG
jgi:ABC-type sugar transport system permease subunit